MVAGMVIYQRLRLSMLRGSRKGPASSNAVPPCPLAPSVQSIIVRTMTRDHAEGLQYHALPTDDPLRALNILREAAGCNHFGMSMKTTAELADFEPSEPRCRVCRDRDVRRLVNHLLDWRGVPIPLGGGKMHQVSYAGSSILSGQL